MKIKKFLTTDKVLEYLENEVQNAANALDIFKIDNQIWENDNIIRDGFLGYAMQYEIEAHQIFNKQIDANEDFAEQILVNEFVELLDHIRYSIGLTQLYGKMKSDSFFLEENENFRFHFNSSTMLSSIASDRIRDFVTLKILNNYDEHKKTFYKKPFIELEDHLKELRLKKELGGVTDNLIHEYFNKIKSLRKIAEHIAIYKKVRNSIVHEAATNNAIEYKRRAKMHKDLKNKICDESSIKWSFNNEYNQGKIEQVMLEYKDSLMIKLEEGMNFLTTWYTTLVDIGDLVFQAHYMKKKVGKHAK